jgi:hypothetical protein
MFGCCRAPPRLRRREVVAAAHRGPRHQAEAARVGLQQKGRALGGSDGRREARGLKNNVAIAVGTGDALGAGAARDAG